MKVAWFKGDSQTIEEWDGRYYSQDEIMALPKGDVRQPVLRILLVPDDTDLSSLSGDDWNDRPADCNASEPYGYPAGAVWLEMRHGDSLEQRLSNALGGWRSDDGA